MTFAMAFACVTADLDDWTRLQLQCQCGAVAFVVNALPEGATVGELVRLGEFHPW